MSEGLFVQNIRMGGLGSEARVTVQERNIFPGVGGEIKSRQTVYCALREEIFAQPGMGRRLFFKHTLFKKLDDYFLRKGRFGFPHVARPLGSVDHGEPKEAYLYEWVFGQEAFPWEQKGADSGYKTVVLKEWDVFEGEFAEAGINMMHDITDPDNGRISKNIIHQLCYFMADGYTLPSCWKRIDFGDSSILIDYEKLKWFLTNNSQDLMSVLGLDRYRLVLLSYLFLIKKGALGPREWEELEMMARKYRLSSLRHCEAGLIIR